MLSRPVLVGYMTGIAILMIASQLGKITGAPVSGDEFVDLMRAFVRNIALSHWPTMVLAASVLLLLLGLGRWAPKMPGPLIAVLAATIVVVALSLETSGIKVVRVITDQWPVTGLPQVAPGEVVALILPAIGIESSLSPTTS